MGVIALVALVGLALASAPSMARLATTVTQTGLEDVVGGAAREARTTIETSTEAITDTPEATTEPSVESSASKYEDGAGESAKDKEPMPDEVQGSGDAESATAKPSKTSDGSNDEANSSASSSASSNAEGGVKTDEAAEAEKSGEKTQEKAQEKTQTREPKEKPKEEQEQSDPPVPANKTMSLSIPRLAQVQGDTVLNSDSPGAMNRAAIKLPSTGFPWREGANTYIAGHRIGWQGTQSRYQFYNLPAMRNGDAVYLTDANGTTYEYRVTEKFAVKPSENWVTEPVAGRDMITLQTCTDSVDPSTWWDITPKLMEAGPNSGRLVVRADKVATYPA
jgi:LPXTG-site transpeptidase (sortase) family protein